MDRWATLFGNANNNSTQVIRPKVEEWAKNNGVDFFYKEVTKAVRDEYNIEVVPTLRYFPGGKNAPRMEGRGEIEIMKLLRFLSQ